MKIGGVDQGAVGLAVRGKGALESFEQEFDFSGVLAASTFLLDLFRVEGGYPTLIRLVRVNYVNTPMAGSWRSGMRLNGAIPNGCRDALYLATGDNRPAQNVIQANGFIPSISLAGEPNWEEDFLVLQDGQVSVQFDFKVKPNVNQALNPVGKIFIHSVRLQ